MSALFANRPDDDDPQNLSPQQVFAMMESWAPEARDKAAKLLEDVLAGHLRAWYCKRGRTCDGKPHRGYNYPHARGDQWPPSGEDWFSWFLSGGRGSGKTRTGAEYTRRMSERVHRIALIAPTGADVRDTMIEGESGLQYVFALAGQKIRWEPSKRRITFPSGAIATTFSGEEPDRLRGPQHGFAWLDEPAHMPQIEDVWSNLMFGLRLGERPHVVLTSTPIPTKWVRRIQGDPTTVVNRVSTYANINNLAPTFRDLVVAQYEGTRKGRQELYGELLMDVEGALWQDGMIQRREIDEADFDRIVVAVDPAGTANRRSDETGIIVAGKSGSEAWVFHDASAKYSPKGWAERTLSLYDRYNADAIVVEKNFGGDMVKDVIQRTVRAGELQPRIIVKQATRSKQLRAEPIVNLYEQGKVFHWNDVAALETEMLSWIPGQGDSPNRVDAMVWALTELMGGGGVARVASARRGNLPPSGPWPRGWRGQ
jgi:phage terminase large subunit-like protein